MSVSIDCSMFTGMHILQKSIIEIFRSFTSLHQLIFVYLKTNSHLDLHSLTFQYAFSKEMI